MNVSSISKSMMEFLNRSPATIAVETSILLLIGLIAIGGNLLVVLSIYRNTSLRTITNYFVLSLAMTDILNPLLSLPFTLAWSIRSRFFMGYEVCDFQVIVSISLMQASITNIVLMAVNRFIRVCKPHKYAKYFNRKNSLAMIVAVWVIHVIIVVSVITDGKIVFANFKANKIMCNLTRGEKTSLSSIFFNIAIVIFFLVPFTIIVYCYYKVFKKIREHKRNVAPPSNPNSLGTCRQEIKVTWTMFAVLVGYCATWFPVLIVVLVSSMTRLSGAVHMIVTYSMAGSSAINPVIYGVMNPAFRREFIKILKLCK
ncbi:melatonin receptor type 1A-like [Actinia tenebrosa]|uniref:Melatonin receptor type 1A-like n=1 Tax=Actinia tenebrosa TaxID=6105 RepID=A0A6P8HPC7_ACTTE|nr:melatonin receptor type 1A-like [Actinia tenebrosa]